MSFRFAFAAVLAAVLTATAPAPAAAMDPSYSGSWYNPPESGSGFNLEIFSDDRALLYWYTYDDAGEPVWLYSEGTILGETIDFDVYYSDGMRFSDLDTADKVNRRWGSLTMTFQTCNTATISYQSELTGDAHSPVGTRTLPVERLVNIDTLPCRPRLSGYWEGRHWDPTLNGGQGAWSDLKGVVDSQGLFMFTSDASNELFYGESVSNPQTAQFAYYVCDLDGDGCYYAEAEASFAPKDFIRGEGESVEYGTQPVELTYRSLYDRDVSLASIAGTWNFEDETGTYVLTIADDGAVGVTGSNGCTFTGTLEQRDANFNAFWYDGASTCHEAGMVGHFVNTDVETGDRKALEIRLITNDGAEPIYAVATRP